MWVERTWSSLSPHQRADLCGYLRGGDERAALAAWAELRRRYPLLCGGMPPKPWVKILGDWCYTVSEADASFCPVAFRWECPPLRDIQLQDLVTLRFVSTYSYPVARGLRDTVGGLVRTLFVEEAL